MTHIKRTKDELWLLRDKHQGEETPEFHNDISRLANGEPVDYVIGFSEFLGAKIDLTHRPLIPRQETEYWVEKIMHSLPLSEVNILDIFAGSGCIGIALLKNLPNSNVDFGEMDPNLIQQIEKNLIINEIDSARTHIYESDVFTNIPPKKYDYIFANPPYISHDRKYQVAKSVIEHEPHMALFTEEDGLFFIKKLLNEAPDFLNPKGKLFMEFDECQKDTIEELAKNSKFDAIFLKDQFDKWRVMEGILK